VKFYWKETKNNSCKLKELSRLKNCHLCFKRKEKLLNILKEGCHESQMKGRQFRNYQRILESPFLWNFHSLMLIFGIKNSLYVVHNTRINIYHLKSISKIQKFKGPKVQKPHDPWLQLFVRLWNVLPYFFFVNYAIYIHETFVGHLILILKLFLKGKL